MRIRPVILDSDLHYLGGLARNESLLLVPFGKHTLIEHLQAWLAPLTREAPLVVSREVRAADFADRIRTACPTATVLARPDELVDTVFGYELSDALLIIDPRRIPRRPLQLSILLNHYSTEPRVSHHLVVFEGAVAGTKERVSFDQAGNVRRILRHYQPITWPFIAGVAATVLPVASGILSDGVIPRSLTDLRQMLATRGVPSRDVPIEGEALDLGDESGVLGASDYFIRLDTATGPTGSPSATPVFLGTADSVDVSARLTGAVIVHTEARIGKNAVVLGPAVIGRGAKIGDGAVVAHSIVGPYSTVPDGQTVRGRVWFDGTVAKPDRDDTGQPFYSDRLAHSMTEARRRAADRDEEPQHTMRGVDGFLKRALDVTAAALALVGLSPLLLVVAVAVWLESKGPIFYGDEREGVGGRVFRCWKFRTMFVGAHAAQMELKALDTTDGPHFKVDDDPRVTRVGRVLRALNVDELPQLFNVLVGNMSLVGPRPSPFRENQVCVPWREARLSVRPGITGFWQVCRHDRAAGDFHQWIEYDLLYVQHMSFWLDMKILTATLITLGGKAGHIPSSQLVASAREDRGSARLDRRTRPAARPAA
jgi:lipopolysaccharide/colanic/teichoic acid biosynthesis glycosyltransferase